MKENQIRNQNQLTTFLIWMRNGVSFTFTWLVILLLIGNAVLGIESVTMEQLTNLLCFVIGAVLIFTILFSRCVLKKPSFLTRLNAFMITFGSYESMCFYYVGMFRTEGTVLSWMIFAGIILISYVVCVGIYQWYSRKKGELYTQALLNYQEMRKQKM